MLTEFQATCGFSIFCLLFAALGVASIIVAKKQRAKCTCQTQAEVTQINILTEESRRGRYDVYRPTVTFGAEGDSYSNINGVGRTSSRYKVGDVVTIFYDPSNPNKSYIRDDYDDDNRNTYVFIVVPIVFAITILASYFINN